SASRAGAGWRERMHAHGCSRFLTPAVADGPPGAPAPVREGGADGARAAAAMRSGIRLPVAAAAVSRAPVRTWKRALKGPVSCLAVRVGFEPAVRYKRTPDF